MKSEIRTHKVEARSGIRRATILGVGFLLLLSQPSILHSQPTLSPNRVLDFDGSGDYVRLPRAGFTNFQQATIKMWVKWRSFSSSARVFDFGALNREMYVSAGQDGISPNSAGMKFLLVDATGARRRDPRLIMSNNNTHPFGPVIYSYTRAQAVADGFQIEVTKTAAEAGIRFPMFITRAVWDAYVAVPPEVTGQDEAGRCWDVVWMTRFGNRS